jgi:hypothetical protein
MSWLNEHRIALQPEIAERRAQGDNILFLSLFGGRIFPYLLCTTNAHEAPLGAELPPWLVAENLAINSLVPLSNGHMVTLLYNTFIKVY